MELAFGSALNEIHLLFLTDPGVPRVRSMGPGLSNSKSDTFWNFADVTLADDDANSILADDANTMAIR